MSIISEAHKMLDEAGWPQAHLVDRIGRLTRFLNDFRAIADRELLERAHRAEAALQEAVAREVMLVWALETVWDKREELYCENRGALGWSIELDVREGNIVRDALRNRDAAARTMLEHWDELQTQVTNQDLRGALQIALTLLETALVPPNAKAKTAADLINDVMTAIREELK